MAVKLDEEVKRYAEKLMRRFHKVEIRKLPTGYISVTPPTPHIASCCCHPRHPRPVGDYNRRADERTYRDYPELENLLRDAGAQNPAKNRLEIGEKSDKKRPDGGGCGIYIGNCAEPHAVKKSITEIRKNRSYKRNPRIDFKQFKFSTAIEVITGEPRNPCVVCQAAFPQIPVDPKLK